MNRTAVGAFLVLVVALLAVSAWAGQPVGKDLAARLVGPFQPPEWLATAKTPFSDKDLTDTNKFGLTIWGGLNKLQGHPDNFRTCVTSLHRALELNRDPKLQADCVQALAIDYEMMFQDYVRGYQMYHQLDALSAKVSQIHDPQNHLSRNTAGVAVLGMARNAALLGLKDHAREFLKGQSFEDWRELLDLAGIDRILGDVKASNADIEKAVAAGAKGDLFAQVSSCGRGVILFYVNGSDDLVRRYLPKYTAARDQLFQGGKPAVNLAGQDELIRVITADNGRQPVVELKGLKDGVYSAEAQGMHGPVKVTATVKAQLLVDLKVEANERQAYGAVVEVPRRIIESRKLPVDAVTGATVTSLTIEQAVAGMLQKARKE